MTEQTKLRWGILGSARINERMLPAIVNAKNSRLHAIASRRAGAAAQILQLYAPGQTEVHCYEKLDDLLQDTEVQAVYCPMSNHEHAQWALKALAAGKHVLCEKPMALRVSEIEAIEAAAKQQNLKVMEGFMYRFHPQYARVHELLNSLDIGEVRTVRASFAFMMRPARVYRLSENISDGGGALWDIGCYAIHSLRPFFNTPAQSVTAISKYVQSGADISSAGVIDFGDGKLAQFEFSFEHARRCEYEIIGTKGGIKCHNVWTMPADAPVISWWLEDGRRGEEVLAPANHFELEIEHFSDCVLNNKQPLLTLDDAKTNCQILNALLQSAAEGRLLKL